MLPECQLILFKMKVTFSYKQGEAQLTVLGIEVR